jgi:ABC-type multidrug transport system fused ATPase/permease subunit
LFAFQVSVRVQLRAGEAIHGALAATVMGAPLRFFEETPSGRLLQRFSRDMDIVDNNLVRARIMLEPICNMQALVSDTNLRGDDQVAGLANVVTSALAIGGSLATLVFASPATALVVPPLAVVYAKTMNRYRPGFRELKRVRGKGRLQFSSPNAACLVCWVG